jgi:hypothetical protein
MSGDDQLRPAARRGRPLFLFFLLGLLTGVFGTILLPRFVAPYLPRSLVNVVGVDELVEGIVRSKRVENERILLTIQSDRGSTLATFDRRLTEIDLLVQDGDSVTLSVRAYAPFMDNPTIQRVMGAGRRPAGPADTATTPSTSDEPGPAGEGTDSTPEVRDSTPEVRNSMPDTADSTGEARHPA